MRVYVFSRFGVNADFSKDDPNECNMGNDEYPYKLFTRKRN